MQIFWHAIQMTKKELLKRKKSKKNLFFNHFKTKSCPQRFDLKMGDHLSSIKKDMSIINLMDSVTLSRQVFMSSYYLISISTQVFLTQQSKSAANMEHLVQKIIYDNALLKQELQQQHQQKIVLLNQLYDALQQLQNLQCQIAAITEVLGKTTVAHEQTKEQLNHVIEDRMLH